MHVPERLGKYQIRRELGRGAMGVVYEGHDPLIDRAVAIKVLRIDEANAALAAEMRLRFQREAQAAGRLSHPNIVSVYDYGEAEGSNSAFIAMELVASRDLKDWFDAGTRFTLSQTGRIMAELLAALQHAHERGVVHRDIKPGNILLLDDGSVKVADFGIAKVDTSELTLVGTIMGTVSHMSPEQLTGGPVDRRSDLFSCGVVLYQLLTGKRPFDGTPAALMHQVLHEEAAAPSTHVGSLPRGLDEVLRLALAKDPAQRFATADAFAAALRTALASDPDPDATVIRPAPTAQAGAPRRPGRPVAALLGLAALVLAGAAGLVLMKRPGDAAAQAVAEPELATLPTAASPDATDCAVEARRGNARCQVVLGQQLRSGNGAARDPAAAVGWYRKAADQGDAAGQYELGAMYAIGLGVPLDGAQAMAWFRKAADQGHARAQNRLGLGYERGLGGETNLVLAAEWYRKAAEQGLAFGQANLGRLYLQGRGVSKDTAQAAAWLQKAADQGEPNAKFNLGSMFENGDGKPRDKQQAARLYREALANPSLSERGRTLASKFLAANP